MMRRGRNLRPFRCCLLALALTATVPAAPAAGSLVEDPWRYTEPIPSGGSAELNAITVVSPAEVWVAGNELMPGGNHRSLLGLRDRTALRYIPGAGGNPALDVTLADIDSAGDDVWTVGRATPALEGSQPRIERYSRTDPGTGVVVPAPAPDKCGELGGIDMVNTGLGWAVGTSGCDQDSTRPLILRWDGTSWTESASPRVGTRTNRLSAVAALPSGEAWAVGQSMSWERPDTAQTLVLHWTGQSWERIPSPDPSPHFNNLLGVAIVGGTNVMAVGYAGAPDDEVGHRHAVALLWDGATWQVLPATSPEATQFSGVAAGSGTDVWLAGYSMIGGVETAHIERYDGVQLQPSPIDPPPATSGTNEVPGTFLNDVAAGPPDSPLWAVGWRDTTFTPGRQGSTLRKDTVRQN